MVAVARRSQCWGGLDGVDGRGLALLYVCVLVCSMAIAISGSDLRAMNDPQVVSKKHPIDGRVQQTMWLGPQLQPDAILLLTVTHTL